MLAVPFPLLSLSGQGAPSSQQGSARPRADPEGWFFIIIRHIFFLDIMLHTYYVFLIMAGVGGRIISPNRQEETPKVVHTSNRPTAKSTSNGSGSSSISKGSATNVVDNSNIVIVII